MTGYHFTFYCREEELYETRHHFVTLLDRTQQRKWAEVSVFAQGQSQQVSCLLFCCNCVRFKPLSDTLNFFWTSQKQYSLSETLKVQNLTNLLSFHCCLKVIWTLNSILTSSIFSKLRTNKLTRTVVGPSGSVRFCQSCRQGWIFRRMGR